MPLISSLKKIENFFFPCSKALELLKHQQQVSMEEFLYAATKAQELIMKPDTQEVINRAFCINKEDCKDATDNKRITTRI